MLDKPWVRWVKVEFHDNGVFDRVSVQVGCALFLAFNFEWAGQVTSNVEYLSVEKQEIVRSAPVWEYDGIDSLFFNLSCSQRVVDRVGSVEGVDIVLSAGEGVVAVLVDRSSGIF